MCIHNIIYRWKTTGTMVNGPPLMYRWYIRGVLREDRDVVVVHEPQGTCVHTMSRPFCRRGERTRKKMTRILDNRGFLIMKFFVEFIL